MAVVASFNVRPKWRGRYYGTVYVCDTKASMIAFVSRRFGVTYDAGFDAICLCGPLWTSAYRNGYVHRQSIGKRANRKGFDRDKRHIFTVVFYVGGMRARHITHESVHAAVHYCRVLDVAKRIAGATDNDIPPEDDPEEVLCGAAGEIARQIVDKSYACGVLQ